MRRWFSFLSSFISALVARLVLSTRLQDPLKTAEIGEKNLGLLQILSTLYRMSIQ